MGGREHFIIAKNPDIVGENPLWHPEERKLYWTDNRALKVHRIDPATRQVETVIADHRVYAFTLQHDGSMLMFSGPTSVLKVCQGDVQVLITKIPGEDESRFNDVIADLSGRVLCGLVNPESGGGAIYRLATDGSLDKIIDNLGMPNGMGFSPDEHTLYLADTLAKIVYAFDYDAAERTPTNQRIYLDFRQTGESPDGLTVDSEGAVWVALSGSWNVRCFDRLGALVDKIELPARKITSVGFGEPDLGTLFITSSSRKPSPSEEIGPEAGALFACRVPVTGKLDHRSKVTA